MKQSLQQTLQQLQQQVLSSITGLEKLGHTVQKEKDLTSNQLLPTAHLSAEHSLAIYQYGYKARLLECLRADYPVLQIFLGQALFEKFALEYLAETPSSCYSLFQLGKKFPAHLKNSCPDITQLSKAEQAFHQLPIELAKLERLRIDSVRAEGLEDKLQQEPNYFDIDQLKKCQPEAPATLGLMKANHKLPDFYQHLRSNQSENNPLPEISLSCIAVSRNNYLISLHIISAWQYAFLKPLVENATHSGASIEQLIEHAALESETEQDFIYAHLPLWLPVAVSRGYLYFQ